MKRFTRIVFVGAIFFASAAFAQLPDSCPIPPTPSDTGVFQAPTTCVSESSRVPASFLFGAEFPYGPARDNPNLCETDSLGFNFLSIPAGASNLSNFQNRNLRIMYQNQLLERTDIPNWALYYTSGLYNKWEPENSAGLAPGRLRLQKKIGRLSSDGKGWSVNTLQDTIGRSPGDSVFLQNSLGGRYDTLAKYNYTQIKCWLQPRLSDGELQYVPREYKVRVWAKIDSLTSDSVLKISLIQHRLTANGSDTFVVLDVPRIYRANEFTDTSGYVRLPDYAYCYNNITNATVSTLASPSPTEVTYCTSPHILDTQVERI